MERASRQLLPVQKGIKRRKENIEQCRALPSPSTNGSTREDVSREHSALAVAEVTCLKQRCPTQLSENKTEKPTGDTSFESHLRKTHSSPLGSGSGAGHKRKHEKELGQADIESWKRPRRSQSAAVPPPNLDQSNHIIQSPEKPATELLKAREIKQKERYNPTSYWAAHHTWPKNFAEHNSMASSNSTNKRQRTSDSQSGKDERSRSYSQSRKDGEVPEQYTAAYEVHIATKGLNMDYRKGEDFVSEESRKICAELLQIKVHTIEPTAVPQEKIRDMVGDCRTRNEAIVNRDVTLLIIPSIRLCYYCGASHLEHVIDEVNADWYSQCILEGPQLRPDLAIGLFSSAFTEEEIDKLKRYTSVNNWTQVTSQMFFPFLMCEVKCGREGLNIADRQNMHSCSVAVRAILRIEQEADKYRQKKGIEKKAESLNRQTLVFSISHDQQDARLYGHYVIVQEEKWTYYRYPVKKFDLTKTDSLLAIHNSVRNILKSHLPEHIKRLKDALAALPDPNNPPSSSGLSFAASGISLNDDSSQQDYQVRDADGFVVPPHPDSSQSGGAKKKGRESTVTSPASMQSQLDSYIKITGKMQGQLDKLMQQLGEEREANRKREEMQRQEHKEEMDKLLQRFLGKAAN